MATDLQIRRAELADIEALLALENQCFETDRLSRRNFRWMIQKAHADLWLACETSEVVAYILTLYVRGTSLARIYSLAVSPQHRQQGLGQQLIKTAEKAALEAGRSFIRLEVRPDNQHAIALYQKLGYQPFDVVHDFYDDHTDAMRMMRVLQPDPADLQRDVMHYTQTTEFTCGPAALMMAMKTLDTQLNLNQTLELQLWREATTIYMTSGHGGCSAQGLALAAYRRGFQTTLHSNSREVPFINGVRQPAKKQVMTCVHADFEQQIAESQIVEKTGPIDVSVLEPYLEQGALAVVLISSYRLNLSKAPHWVVVAGISSKFVYFHDPDIDYDSDKTLTDSFYVPVTHVEFNRMLGFGRPRYQAAVLLQQSINHPSEKHAQ